MNFPTRKLRRVTILIAGWASILLGMAGIFLPILPGFAFLFVGLALFSSEYRWAHTMLRRIKVRLPAQVDKVVDSLPLSVTRELKEGSSPLGND